jgi:ATP-dependent helicase YprA (DUF1998 family)
MLGVRRRLPAGAANLSRSVRQMPLASFAMDTLDPTASRLTIQFKTILEKAREKARKSKRNYDSQDTRSTIIKNFKDIFNGLEPYEWQLDVSEAILLGLDTTVIAGTGSGKTIPFILPLLATPASKKIVLIISPLKELQKDQVRRFNDMKIPAVALNQDTWNQKIAKVSLVNINDSLFF